MWQIAGKTPARIPFCDNVNITELVTLLFPPEAWKLPQVCEGEVKFSKLFSSPFITNLSR